MKNMCPYAYQWYSNIIASESMKNASQNKLSLEFRALIKVKVFNCCKLHSWGELKEILFHPLLWHVDASSRFLYYMFDNEETACTNKIIEKQNNSMQGDDS